MKDIDEIRQILRGIEKAICEPINPYQKPPLSSEKIESPDPLISGDPDFDYPPWMEKEILEPRDNNMKKEGIDALAWYVSFHYDQDSWGIYIPVESLAYLELRYLQNINKTRFQKWKIAFNILMEHELFHFATDYMCAQWEILLKNPCWCWLTTQKRSHSPNYLEIEEKLANVYMLRLLKDNLSKSIFKRVIELTKNQPPGYRDAISFIENSKIDDEFELMELTKYYIGPWALKHDLNILTDVFDYSVFYPIEPRIDWKNCPIHIIKETPIFKDTVIHFIQKLPNINVSDNFLKSLMALHPSIQKKWERKKKDLLVAIPPYPEFEKLKGKKEDIYSIRVGRKYRAHLKPTKNYQSWEAIDIGTHTEMGHG